MSNYPRDEFDRVPEASARQGVHRARMEPPRSRRLGIIVTAGILALLIGVVSFFILPQLGTTSGSAGNVVAAAPSASDAAVSDAAVSDADEATAGTVSEDDESTSGESTSENSGSNDDEAIQSPTPTKSTSPTTEPVDKSVPVAVLNSTLVSGLAADVAGRVSVDGWTVPTIANWAGQPQPASAIYYAGPSQKSNAKALGKVLGITSFVETSRLRQPLTVVLGPGFQG